MELIAYTIAAVILYIVSDYILNTIEIRMGKRLPNRSLIFLVIISILAVSSFGILRTVLDKPKPAEQTTTQPASTPQVDPTQQQ